MNLNLRQRLDRRQQMQRQQYQERITAAENRPMMGTVTGYDVEAGGYRMQIAGGGSIVAESLSNGAIPTGATLQIATARNSTKAAIDGMPR